jgi:Mn-dependent DtxR family transcriptional regulator
MCQTLKGSRKDVYEKLREILEEGEQPSIAAIAHCTGWSVPTVQRSLSELRERGVIHYDQEIPGRPARYEILQELS